MNKNSIMNILLSCDERLAKYIPILLSSIYPNNKDVSVRTFLMYTKISDEIVEIIRNFAETYGQKIVMIVTDNKDFRIFEMLIVKDLIHPMRYFKVYMHLFKCEV